MSLGAYIALGVGVPILIILILGFLWFCGCLPRCWQRRGDYYFFFFSFSLAFDMELILYTRLRLLSSNLLFRHRVMFIWYRETVVRTTWRKVFLCFFFPTDPYEEELPSGTFTLRQIKFATDDFNPINKIGEGGFGAVFKVKDYHGMAWFFDIWRNESCSAVYADDKISFSCRVRYQMEEL